MGSGSRGAVEHQSLSAWLPQGCSRLSAMLRVGGRGGKRPFAESRKFGKIKTLMIGDGWWWFSSFYLFGAVISVKHTQGVFQTCVPLERQRSVSVLCGSLSHESPRGLQSYNWATVTFAYCKIIWGHVDVSRTLFVLIKLLILREGGGVVCVSVMSELSRNLRAPYLCLIRWRLKLQFAQVKSAAYTTPLPANTQLKGSSFEFVWINNISLFSKSFFTSD